MSLVTQVIFWIIVAGEIHKYVTRTRQFFFKHPPEIFPKFPIGKEGGETSNFLHLWLFLVEKFNFSPWREYNNSENRFGSNGKTKLKGKISKKHMMRSAKPYQDSLDNILRKRGKRKDTINNVNWVFFPQTFSSEFHFSHKVINFAGKPGITLL